MNNIYYKKYSKYKNKYINLKGGKLENETKLYRLQLLSGEKIFTNIDKIEAMKMLEKKINMLEFKKLENNEDFFNQYIEYLNKINISIFTVFINIFFDNYKRRNKETHPLYSDYNNIKDLFNNIVMKFKNDKTENNYIELKNIINDIYKFFYNMNNKFNINFNEDTQNLLKKNNVKFSIFSGNSDDIKYYAENICIDEFNVDDFFENFDKDYTLVINNE